MIKFIKNDPVMAFIAVLVFILVTSWSVNFYKLTNCDFKSPLKCEAIHGIGIIPILAPLTMWFSSDAQ